MNKLAVIVAGVIYGMICMSLIPLANADLGARLAAEVGYYGVRH